MNLNNNQSTWEEVIIKLHPTEGIQTIIDFIELEKRSTLLTIDKPQVLSHSLNIWLLKINLKEHQFKHIYDQLSTHPAVELVQKNRPIYERAIPNDSLFIHQWQYLNRGSNHLQVLDADIDATEAWDITTGGKTVQDDEIVIAIIDSGIRKDHIDLKDNIWTNEYEVPDNSIDDDQNGYIDDYYGWNYRDNTNDVTNSGVVNGAHHGTPVAGIIGAKGNNHIGVTGINWDIKILNLVKGGTEATTIMAYNYILDLRQKYNNTNGQEGAFIVATNASSGRDFGRAEDAPIWCSLFDELGRVGIINVGATINQSVDVDIEGDLPTTCPSDFLIGVTNTNDKDLKNSAAGYGKINIDLGAPGEGSYMFEYDRWGNYGRFGGTSAAAPHVAGAVGLLYSVPCPAFMEDVKKHPAKAASLMKAFIMAGTDKLEALQGITVSGGRLNLYKSIIELQKHYDCLDVSSDLSKYGVSIKHVYPNPADEWMIISYEILEPAHLYLAIYSRSGQLVKEIEDLGEQENGHYEKQIDVSSLTPGVYFLSLKLNNKPVKSKKIIIQ